MANWEMECIGCKETITLECPNCEHKNLQLHNSSEGEYFECFNCKEDFEDYEHICSFHVDGYYGEVITGRATTYVNRNRDNFFERGKGGFYLIFGFIVLSLIYFVLL